MPIAPAHGRHFTAPGYEPVAELVTALAAAGDSCAVAAFVNHGLVVHVWGGAGVRHDSLAGVYSVSKGVAGICVALLVERGALDPESPVCRYWPEFAAQGKDAVTVGQLLSHQAGLICPPGGCTLADILAHDPLAARLARMRPLWEPGTAHGYHALTIGVLIEELVRRLTGSSLREFYDREIRWPLGAEFYLGLPAALESRVTPVRTCERLGAGDSAGRAATAGSEPRTADSYAAMALGAPAAFPLIADLPSLRSVRAAGPSAFGGVGSALGLAQIYDACLRGTADGALLSDETLGRVTDLRSSGPDLVLGRNTRYGLVFQKPAVTMPFGSQRAFGHDGAGGSLAFADPANQLSFAHVALRFRATGGASLPAYAVLRTVRDCARSAPG